MKLRAWILVAVALGPLLVACFPEGGDDDDGWPESSPAASSTSPSASSPTPQATRRAYQDVGADWQGREAYFICVEDRTGNVGDVAAADLVEDAIRQEIAASNPSLPVVTDAGCPFDYPDGPLATRSDPNRYLLQVYIVSNADDVVGEIAERWFRGQSDSSTPITFMIRVPLDRFDDTLALQSALGPYVLPEPTQKPA